MLDLMKDQDLEDRKTESDFRSKLAQIQSETFTPPSFSSSPDSGSWSSEEEEKCKEVIYEDECKMDKSEKYEKRKFSKAKFSVKKKVAGKSFHSRSASPPMLAMA